MQKTRYAIKPVYYKKAIKISDVQELGDVMISQLSNLFEKKKNPKKLN